MFLKILICIQSIYLSHRTDRHTAPIHHLFFLVPSLPFRMPVINRMNEVSKRVKLSVERNCQTDEHSSSSPSGCSSEDYYEER